MMVELGNRVDERICETYLRNSLGGSEPGMILMIISSCWRPLRRDLQFLGHLGDKRCHHIHLVIKVLCDTTSWLLFFLLLAVVERVDCARSMNGWEYRCSSASILISRIVIGHVIHARMSMRGDGVCWVLQIAITMLAR
jgi:hypothetical protein